jgi:hypothetical protein
MVMKSNLLVLLKKAGKLKSGRKTVSINFEPKPCVTKGCGGMVSFVPERKVGYISNPGARSECVAGAGVCPKCKRMHENPGVALTLSGGGKLLSDKIFLGKDGWAIVKARNGRVIFKLWTTRAKPPKLRGKGPLIKAK